MALVVTLLAAPVAAHATLPEWLQHVVGATSIEAAIFRTMHLPSEDALYPRPPKEAQAELAHLISAAAGNAELYQLRARIDEQALDENAAEADWKLYAAHAKDHPAAQLELANFYQRRLMIPQEIAALNEVAAAPSPASETYVSPIQQRSWQAYERLIALASDQALPPTQTASTLAAFLNRYPDQPSVYALDLKFFLAQKDFQGADGLVARYRKQFPQERIFPVRADVLIAQTRGDTNAALAVYDRAFEPLWQPALIQSYFSLLDQTHLQRAFVADARARLAANPNGPEALNALARIFYYDQEAGRLDAAQRTLDGFRVAREAGRGAWTPLDLYTLATLAEATHAYAESARYNYALASSEGTLPSGEPAAQSGLAGLVHTLLEAPDQPLAIGAQNLTLYRDIATLDEGPGYWNGILSLWLNGSGIHARYNAENDKAQSYFHRAKAAELLADLDSRFPKAAERPTLHAELLHAISQYGEPATVITEGKQFLASFPDAPQRLEVVDLMADAYARRNDTTDEFALYDAELTELAIKTKGMPLSAADARIPPPAPSQPPDGDEGSVRVTLYEQSGTYQGETSVNTMPDGDSAPAEIKRPGLTPPPSRRSIREAAAYTRELDRYLGRLEATHNLPRALTVLRAQLDRSPDDPMLYEKLATFLQQNNLSAQEEKTYQLAIEHFQQPNWYDKLARMYLREKKRDAFAELTSKVTDIFSGTEVDAYFSQVHAGEPVGPQVALKLNLYAAKRFPRDLVFTRNLLTDYQSSGTHDSVAFEELIRRVWWESPDLENQFLTWLSRTGKLNAERAALERATSLQSGTSPDVGSVPANLPNPAAIRELAAIDIFTSHYEEATPLLSAVANLYPADADIGDTALSLFRSAGYLDPSYASTQRAVALETNLLNAAPDNFERLATLGDLYAEATRTGGEDLASAAPYWHRMTALHPGSTQGFLLSATIFWDYFQFDDALAELNAARTRFHAPWLFAYEAGAIEENRHHMSAAVVEYTHAVLHPLDAALKQDSAFGVLDNFFKPPSDAADSNLWAAAQSFVGTPEASGRLLTLAKRKSTAEIVDKTTATEFATAPTNTAALTLRADVLSAQHKAPELNVLLTTLFDQALTHAATFDQAQAVGGLAQTRTLTQVYERALAKQADLTPDPVLKIELRYTLAHSLESRSDLAGATRIMDAVYHANPRVLGVVRATTNFYSRNNEPERAIATLLEAAKAATPDRGRDFTLEAADRGNEAGVPAQARALATTLLQRTPYDARVLAVISTSYTQGQDDVGLKQFFLARLDAARTDPKLSTDERRQNIALLRRGLIPALTRSKDYEGAIDQYIALLSAFPEDTATTQEAALYARKYGREAQLVDFLRTTVRQSPKDSRFAALLGQVETAFGDLPAAEAAWSQAIVIRQDRVDFYTARVNLELRLSQQDPGQFELAANDFSRLYLLSYHDPSWMVRLAALRARQQRPDEAIKALRTAYIEGHAETAKDFFAVADHLAQWNLFAQAQSFAAHGVALAGSDLLAIQEPGAYPPQPSGPVTYARIMARLGKAGEALTRLRSIRHDVDKSSASPSVLAAELAREQVPADDARASRQNFAQQRRQTADTELRVAVNAIGNVVETYYTPEQKLSYVEYLDHLHDDQADADPALAIQAATAAGLADREAAWRRQLLLTGPYRPEDLANFQAYTALERRRLAFGELARTLEAYAPRVRRTEYSGILQQAAQAYRDAGDTTNEMRLERVLVLHTNAEIRDRYFDLLLHHDHAALTALASSKNVPLADAAVNYTLAHATQAQALAAVARRGQALPAVWRPASASLVQTYFASPQTTVANLDDFTQALASDVTIGGHIGKPVSPTKQLTGDNFFYYASRFGVFLATVVRTPALPDPEDFLPAQLESSPTSPESYRNLGRSYAEAGNTQAASLEYKHVLELAPATSDTPAIEDEFALILFRANRREEAVQHWHNALANLLRMQQHAIYPEQFFTSFKTVLDHLGQRHLAAEFRPEIVSILSGYLARNGNYRSNELLKAAYKSAVTPQEGIALVVQLAASAADPLGVLDDLHNQPWLDAEGSETLLPRQIDLARARPQDESSYSQQTPSHYQLKLISVYLAENKIAKAAGVLSTLSDKELKTQAQIVSIVIATRSDHLAAVIDRWRSNPESVPTDYEFSSALYALQQKTAAYKPHPTQIRPLAEFVFEHKRQDGKLAATDYLMLAQLRLDTHDLAGTIDLLRQLSLRPALVAESIGSDAYFASTSGDSANATASPYSNIDSSAALLEKNHHPAEALLFLESLTQLEPWNATYRLRLAEAQRDSGAKAKAQPTLIAVAKDPFAAYGIRVKAARDLAAYPDAGDLNSRELTVVAHPGPPDAARLPYFTAARSTLAQQSAISVRDRHALLREAIAIDPNGVDSDRNRLDLLLAQSDRADPSVTLGILRSMQNQPAPIPNATEADDPETAAQSDEPEAYSESSRPATSSPIALPPLAATLDLPTQTRLATQLASASERDGDLDTAVRYAELAVTLNQDDKPDPALIRRREDLRTQVQLQRRNAARRPNLHKELAQSTQVRPRLAAAALAQENAP